MILHGIILVAISEAEYSDNYLLRSGSKFQLRTIYPLSSLCNQGNITPRDRFHTTYGERNYGK